MSENLTDLARVLNLTFGPGRRGDRLPRGFAMTDPERTPDPGRLIDALPAGFALIFRHYGQPDRARLAAEAVGRGRRQGVAVLIADDPGLAARIGAAGVHLPGYRLRRGPPAAVWRRRPDWLVTGAAHRPRDLIRAGELGLDAALVSPVYPTTSHRRERALGVLRAVRMCRGTAVPVFGLGGLNHGNIPGLRGSGFRGIAGIGLFLRP